MNEVVFNKERKKERKSRLCLNFYLTNGDEDQALLDRIETLRHRDRWSITRFLKEASLEYVNRHLPGNPGLPLEHWTKNLAFSEAAKEKLATLPPQPKPAPNYAEMSTENLTTLYRHPWKLEGFNRQLVGHILKRDRGIDIEKIKRDLK